MRILCHQKKWPNISSTNLYGSKLGIHTSSTCITRFTVDNVVAPTVKTCSWITYQIFNTQAQLNCFIILYVLDKCPNVWLEVFVSITDDDTDDTDRKTDITFSPVIDSVITGVPTVGPGVFLQRCRGWVILLDRWN